MKGRAHSAAVAAAWCLMVASIASANVFDMGPGLTSLKFVPVSDPGNADDINYGYGGVDYTYGIGKYEATAGQYCEFLNAVATTDTYGLYNTSMWSSTYGCKIQRSGSAGSYTYSVAVDRANRPVNFVSWGDAARFANWLQNGQPTGAQDLSTTEDGSYLLNGAMTGTQLLAATREANTEYLIPSEDEWYKAAYYDPDYHGTTIYYDYPTNTNAGPSNDLVDPDPGNNANYFDGAWAVGSPYWTTEVGEFENSESPWRTFDQGGNVWEWNEAAISSSRGLRGGSFGYSHGHSGFYLLSAYRHSDDPTAESEYIGFRVATAVPEPATLSLLALGGLAFRLRSRRAFRLRSRRKRRELQEVGHSGLMRNERQLDMTSAKCTSTLTLLVAVLAVTVFASEASAETFTEHNWQGAGTSGDMSNTRSDTSTLWEQTGNWAEGTLPDDPNSNAHLWLTNAGTVFAPVGTTELHTVDVDGTADGGNFCVDDEATDFRSSHFYVGWNGVGTVAQTGGSLVVTNGMRLAKEENSVGTYHLSGGSLVVWNYDLDIGYQGEGHFIHTGGTYTTWKNAMVLGADETGVGHYTLSGTGQIVDGNTIYVGESGTGVYTQTGGTAWFDWLWVGSPNDSASLPRNGTANISGGTLAVGKLTVGSSCSNPVDATFAVKGAGATIQVGGDGFHVAQDGKLRSELDVTGISAIAVDGPATLDGTWMIFDHGVGFGRFDILTATGGISGAFDTVLLPDELTWSYGITENTLWVQQVPEPTTLGLLAVALLGAVRRWRREGRN